MWRWAPALGVVSILSPLGCLIGTTAQTVSFKGDLATFYILVEYTRNALVHADVCFILIYSDALVYALAYSDIF
jgi:hypothetical protein